MTTLTAATVSFHSAAAKFAFCLDAAPHESGIIDRSTTCFIFDIGTEEGRISYELAMNSPHVYQIRIDPRKA